MQRLSKEELAELEAWAQQVAQAVSAEELAGLVRHYRAIARNERLEAEDRSIARRRVRLLTKFTQR